ncbi:MAG: hypothetical protein R6U62_08620 [Bacteroidales bacterium]
MKNIVKMKTAGVMLVITALFLTSCEPYEEDWGDIGEPVPAEQLEFEITQDPDDEFNYIFENTSGITGITHWDLGGIRESGETVSRRFPLPDTYTIKMTLATQGGTTTITDSLVQEEVDPGLFDNPLVLLLGGGLDNFEEGQTWAMDSMSVGHLGVGPPDENEPVWWQAQPLDKAGVGVLYPDRMTFKLDGFQFIYENHGQSYVKDFRADDPAYSNAYEDETDYVVDFDPPEATWNLVEQDDTWFLELTPMESKPIFPIFDVGAVDNLYEITELTENQLWLRAIGGDGNAWYYKFITEGYEHED